MKNLFLAFSLFVYCLNLFCQNQNDSTSQSVSFEFDSKMERVIILEAKINDSIRSRMIFDTGWSGIFVPRRFLSSNIVEKMSKEKNAANTPIKVHIADKWEYSYPKIVQPHLIPPIYLTLFLERMYLFQIGKYLKTGL